MSIPTPTISIPGRFDGFFSGSAVGQGQTENYSSDPYRNLGAFDLYESYRRSRRVRRGRGYSRTLEGLTRDAVYVLLDYAETCIAVNDSEPDYAERSAAAKVAAECRTWLSLASTQRVAQVAR